MSFLSHKGEISYVFQNIPESQKSPVITEFIRFSKSLLNALRGAVIHESTRKKKIHHQRIIDKLKIVNTRSKAQTQQHHIHYSTQQNVDIKSRK